ncbi:MAG TPA: RagB/SusD family nutrient uptake outer membrane protein [Bacteroidales bacterium]|nr:RagB/SusD family nutrient uptake outer membrane protein [Bacteroidales bacterium]
MKKILIIICLFSTAVILFDSCSEDYLNRYPLDQISDATFWNSENDLKVYNNGLYDMCMDHFNNTTILWGNGENMWSGNNSYNLNNWNLDCMSDNLTSGNSRHEYMFEIRAGVHIVKSGGSWRGGEQWLRYQGFGLIRAINIGLANYSKAKVGQDIIDNYTAEARLFRGWHYADLCAKFGDANWIDKELSTDSEELTANRTPREEVMEKALADLEFACQKLPDSWNDGGAPGRINRWAALAITSRLCLFEGTWRKYHGGTDPNKWLQKAADAALELMQNSKYSLYSTGNTEHDYSASFQVLKTLAGNKEVLYWRKYELGVAVNNANVNGGEGPTKSMVEDYLCTDGLPITLSPLYKGDEIYENVFENRDPRLRQSVLHPADQAYYNFGRSTSYNYPRVNGMTGGVKSLSGYHFLKYYNAIDAGLGWGQHELPSIIIRLGEVYLIYAEAKAELGSLTQADLDISINKLRDRVGMIHMDMTNIPVDPRYANDGVSPLIVEIRRERRVELFAEGLRYLDLRRWKQGKKLIGPSLGMRWDDAARAKYDPLGEATVKTSLVNGVEYVDVYKGTNWGNPVFDESKHYLFPIDLYFLSLNPSISQNPGWD